MPYSVPRRGSRHSTRLDRQSSVESHGSLHQSAAYGVPSSPSRHLSALPVNVIIQRASASPTKGQEEITEMDTTPMRKRRAMQLRPIQSEIPTPPTSHSDEGSKPRADNATPLGGRVRDIRQKEITPTPTPTPTPSTGKRSRDTTSANGDNPSSAFKRRATQERKMERSIYMRSNKFEIGLITRQMSPQTELSLLQDQSAPTGFHNDMSDDDDDEAYIRDRCILLPTKRTRDMSRSRILSDTSRTPTKPQIDLDYDDSIDPAQYSEQRRPEANETEATEVLEEADTFHQHDEPDLPPPEIYPEQDSAAAAHSLHDAGASEAIEKDTDLGEEVNRLAEQWRRPTTPMTPAFDFDAATPHKSPFTPRIAANLDLPMESTPVALFRRKTPTSKRKSLPHPDQERKVRASLAALNSPHKAQRLPVEIEEERLRIRHSSEIPASSPLSRLRHEAPKSISPSPLRQAVRERELSVILAQEMDDEEENSDLEDLSHFTIERTYIKDAASPRVTQAYEEVRHSPIKRSREESEEILEDDFVYETVVVENGQSSPSLHRRQERLHDEREEPEEETFLANLPSNEDIGEEEIGENHEKEQPPTHWQEEELTDEGDEENETMAMDERRAVLEELLDRPLSHASPADSVASLQGDAHHSSGEDSDAEEDDEVEEDIDIMSEDDGSLADEEEEQALHDDVIARSNIALQRRDDVSYSKQDDRQDSLEREDESVGYGDEGEEDDEEDEEDEEQSDGDIEEEASSVSGEKEGSMDDDDGYSEDGDVDIEENDVHVDVESARIRRGSTVEDDARSEEEEDQVATDDEEDDEISVDASEASDDEEANRQTLSLSREDEEESQAESEAEEMDETDAADEKRLRRGEYNINSPPCDDREDEQENREEEGDPDSNGYEFNLLNKASPRLIRKPRHSIVASSREERKGPEGHYGNPASSNELDDSHRSHGQELEDEDMNSDDENDSEADVSTNCSSSPVLEAIHYNPMKDMRIDQEEAQRRQQMQEESQMLSIELASATSTRERHSTDQSSANKYDSQTGNDSALVPRPNGAHNTPLRATLSSPHNDGRTQNNSMEGEANTTVVDFMRDRMERLKATENAVEITSLNTEVAARCAAILEQNYQFVQYGSVMTAVEEDYAGLSIYRTSEASRSGLDDSLHCRSGANQYTLSERSRRSNVGARPSSRPCYDTNSKDIAPAALHTPKTPMIPGQFPGSARSNDSALTPTLSKMNLRADQSGAELSRGSLVIDEGKIIFASKHWDYLEDLINRKTEILADDLAQEYDLGRGDALWEATIHLNKEAVVDDFLGAIRYASSQDDMQSDCSKTKIVYRVSSLLRKLRKKLIEQYPEIKDLHELSALQIFNLTSPIEDLINESTFAETTSRIPYRLVTQSTPTPATKAHAMEGNDVSVSVIDDGSVTTSNIYPPLPSAIFQSPRISTAMSQAQIPPPPPPLPPPTIQGRDRVNQGSGDDHTKTIAALASKSLDFIRTSMKWSKDAAEQTSQQRQAIPERSTEAKEPPRKTYVPIAAPVTASQTSKVDLASARKSKVDSSHLLHHTSSMSLSNQTTTTRQYAKGPSEYGRTGTSSSVCPTALVGISPNSQRHANILMESFRESREARGGTPRRNRVRDLDKSITSVNQSRFQ